MIDLFVRPQTPTTREFIRTIVNHDMPDIFSDIKFSAVPTPGSTLMLRLSFIGASANVVIVDLARRAGHQISYWQFFAFGFPVMVGSIILATVYLWLLFP